MIHISRTPEYSNCGSTNCTSPDGGIASITGGRSRQRSHSYYSPEDCKNYGAQVQTTETNLRPRSRYVHTINFDCTFSAYLFSISVSLSAMLPRSFYSFETSESDVEPQTERSSFFQQFQKEKEVGGGHDPLTSRKSKPKQNKTSSRELSGKHFIGIYIYFLILYLFEIYIILGYKTMHFVRE